MFLTAEKIGVINEINTTQELHLTLKKEGEEEGRNV